MVPFCKLIYGTTLTFTYEPCFNILKHVLLWAKQICSPLQHVKIVLKGQKQTVSSHQRINC